MSDDVSDPTDWHATSLPFLAQFDAGLRCQVCKDYFTSAVLTTCSHTFCSLCIRRCLAAEGRCPTCRTNEQEARLRRNVAVQELTDMFVAARPEALQRARNVLRREDSQVTHDQGGGRKRKRGEGTSTNGAASPPRRRSQRLQVNGQASPSSQEGVLADDGAQNLYQQPDGDEAYEPDDGLVSCPICCKRMKAEAVFGHLDNCEGDQKSKNRRSSHSLPHSHTTTSTQIQQENKPPPERLPQINYSLLKDNALRKKLSELSISASGPRTLLIRRHTEWINLWNANCDSARPRSRRELLVDLDAWERSQGRFAANGGQPQTATVMLKDFDGPAWSKKNKDDFSHLIAAARRKREQPAAAPAPASFASTSAQDATAQSLPPHLADSTLSSAIPNAPSDHQNPSFSHRGLASAPASTSDSTHIGPTIQPRRGSVQWLDNDPPSIFSPPHSHPAIEIQRTCTRSPVPGFAFDKSVQFGGREPLPPRLLHTGSQPSSVTTPELRSPNGPRASRTEWPQTATTAPVASGQRHAQERRQSMDSQSLMSLQTSEAQPELCRDRSRDDAKLGSSHKHGTKKLPMFEVPGDPVTDAEMGGTK